MFDVAASVTPRANKPANRLPSSIASAMSVTANSSKQMMRVSLAISVGDELERVLDVAVLLQPLVHGRHEAMEVLSAFVRERQRVEEEIHHECLAAPDAAPEIEAARRLAALAGELRDLAAPAAWRRRAQQVAVQALERFDGARLRRIGRELAALDALAIECEWAGHAFSSGRSTK